MLRECVVLLYDALRRCSIIDAQLDRAQECLLQIGMQLLQRPMASSRRCRMGSAGPLGRAQAPVAKEPGRDGGVEFRNRAEMAWR
jgi:hypothetical protein